MRDEFMIVFDIYSYTKGSRTRTKEVENIMKRAKEVENMMLNHIHGCYDFRNARFKRFD